MKVVKNLGLNIEASGLVSVVSNSTGRHYNISVTKLVYNEKTGAYSLVVEDLLPVMTERMDKIERALEEYR
ncbi:MAG: hypothetical protein M1165_02370 [Candidatus Pacearchaeota archaeon]|nr:hypothetical protein [Candidatus Pacearchaeota archaeon]MDE1848717.1 hypothetical protein [Nanoarchaeota archaeon]